MMNRFMGSWVFAVMMWVLLPGVGVAAEAAVMKRAERVDIETAMKKVYPALVRIFVVSTQASRGREVKRGASGSGAIISPEGYVVTNHHVVGKGTRIWVTLSNRQRVDAKLIGTDALADIAIIKLLPESMRHPVKTFPFAKWGDSDKLKVGDKVFAMGSPGSLSQSVTYGIVANAQMVMPGGRRSFILDGEPVGSLVRWIMHDAQIFGGNSGGPLVNVSGDIVGINEIGTAALGGAIPANTARQAADGLIKNGFIARSWTGILTHKLLHSDKTEKGVLVRGTIKDSPGEKAGIQARDIILAVNGTPIQVRYAEQMPEFNRLILQAPIGAELTLLVQRDGKETTVKVKTVARGKAQGRDHEVKSWGITARDITALTRIRMRRDTTNGVLISSMRPGGPVGQARPRLVPGDIILTVGGKLIKNLADLKAVNQTITAGKTKAVPTIVTYWRKAEELMTVVKIGPVDEAQPVPTMRKSWFPAKLQVLTKPLARALGIAGTKGMRITRIYPQLRQADFKIGDIITHVNGMMIDASEPQHAGRFPTRIRRIKVGSAVKFRILRGKEKVSTEYTLTRAPRPDQELPKYHHDFLEFRIRELSIMDRNDMRLPVTQTGVILSEVKRGGWAHMGGLRVNDIVLRVGTKTVTSVADFTKIMAQIDNDKPDTVLFFIQRGIGTNFAEVRPDWVKAK